MANELAIHEAAELPAELSVSQVIDQIKKIQTLMRDAMTVNEHYGVIPGTERKDKDGKDVSKPTLLKPGAEKLCFMFRLAPSYAHVKERNGRHLIVSSTCTLTHIPSQLVFGTGSSECSTYESKYAWRQANRVCPNCGKEAIIKGRPEYGGGWLCWKTKDGCGAKFHADAKEIVEQPAGRVENVDVADQWNTIVKMADKRALIAAVLNVTAASDIFTQDLEELEENSKAAAKEAVGGGAGAEEAERKRADNGSAALTASQGPSSAGPEAATKRAGRPPKDQPVDTTAILAPTSATATDPKATLSAADCSQLQAEMSTVGIIEMMVLKSLPPTVGGPKERMEDLTYEGALWTRNMIAKRKAMKGAA